MTNPDFRHAAVTRCLHTPQPNTIRLWTIQPPAVWNALQTQGALLVNDAHPEFTESLEHCGAAYEWMRQQMAKRIPGYVGRYPWWAYTHFLDLRRCRWHEYRRPGQRLVRLELAVPKAQVLLSSYGKWHWVLNRWYLGRAWGNEVEYDLDMAKWDAELLANGVNKYGLHSLPEPWESRMQSSWEQVFACNPQDTDETIQATFERLELTEVVKVTEFTSTPR